MIKRENLLKSKTSPKDKELNKQILLAEKTGTLKLCGFALKSWPAKVFELTNLQVIDLSYNNLEDIPVDIKVFKELKYLYLNNNPIQSVPIEISECKKLKSIDLSNTLVKWLPREMAKLSFLSDINLASCPLKGNLTHTYQLGINALMTHFQRKLDRSIYREHLVKFLKEWVYVSSTRDEVQEMIEIVFKEMKDLETKHLKRLLKNAQYLFPKEIEDVDAREIKRKLVESFNEKISTTKVSSQAQTFNYNASTSQLQMSQI